MANKAKPKTEIPLTSELAERASGSNSTIMQHRLINELYETLWLPNHLDDEERMKRILAAIERVEEIKPRDGTERMLAVQMVATHNAALECLRRAMLENQSFEGRQAALKHGTKLLQVYERQLAALDKHRGKGQQKVTVEHVHVEAGGRAIVGNVDARRGSNAGEAAAEPRTEEQQPQGDAATEAARLAHDPSDVVDLDLAAASRRRRAPVGSNRKPTR